MKIIEGIKYSKEHEWIKAIGDLIYIGITDYAQQNLGDVVYIEFPNVGDTLKAGDEISVIESVKAASDIYTPVSGKVMLINEELNDDIEKINEDPYGSWIAALEPSDSSELETLMDAAAYKTFCEEE